MSNKIPQNLNTQNLKNLMEQNLSLKRNNLGKADQRTFQEALSDINQDVSDNDGTDLAYRNIAHKFETESLGIMWNSAFETVEVDPLFGGGKAEETFKSYLVQSFVDEAYATQKSKIQEAIYNKLKRKEQDYDTQQSTRTKEVLK
jgi:hypothetical protein